MNSMLYNRACERLAMLRVALGVNSPELLDLIIIGAEREVALLTPPPGVLHPMPTYEVPEVPEGVCLFCRCHRNDVEGKPCASFAGSHEFRGAPPAPVQTRRLDLNRCTKCDLHKKNPASASSDCQHTYPEAP
jgi:hypothetical protein